MAYQLALGPFLYRQAAFTTAVVLFSNSKQWPMQFLLEVAPFHFWQRIILFKFHLYWYYYLRKLEIVCSLKKRGNPPKNYMLMYHTDKIISIKYEVLWWMNSTQFLQANSHIPYFSLPVPLPCINAPIRTSLAVRLPCSNSAISSWKSAWTRKFPKCQSCNSAW